MITDLLGLGLIVVGLFFMSVAAIGFVRFPDVYCRLHVTCVLDTLGAPMVLLGVAVQAGLSLLAGKLLLAIVLLFMTSPLVGHLLSTAAIQAGHRPETAGYLPDGDARKNGTPAEVPVAHDHEGHA